MGVGVNSCAVGRGRLLAAFAGKEWERANVFSCPGEGRDWALRPTAQEFTPTLVLTA